MKNRKKKRERRAVELHLWTIEQARQALPYLTSVMGSLRETRLEALTQDLRRQRLADKPGRPDTHALVALQDATQAAGQADGKFMDALMELQRMSVFLMDPVKGLALIPFLHGERVAWYVFDLFAEEHLSGWRYQEDDLEMRRPMAEVETAPATISSFVV